MAERQTVTVSVDAGELPGTQATSWSTLRKSIDEGGALGVGNGFGVLTLALNGHAAVHLRLHEDAQGYAVIDVHDGRSSERLARVQVELYGLVPPRLESKGRRG